MPETITRKDEGIELDWGPAVGRALIPSRELRLACPCAECVEEMSGRRLLDPATIPADIRPVHLALVGGYGLRVHWSDGHATGIFTFDSLRARLGAPTS